MKISQQQTRLPFHVRLEPFEWMGLVASIAAACIFFTYGPALDKLVGEPGYHWDVLLVVVKIYLNFIPWALGTGTVGVFLLTYWLRKRNRGVSFREILRRYGMTIRIFLAYCLLLIVFRVVNFFVPVLHPGIYDGTIQAMDAKLLGGRQVSEWLEPLVHPWLTHLLTGAYVAWFWLLFATLGLLATVHRRVVSEYVLASLTAFYVGYICYVLVPVIGPGYTLHYQTAVGDIAPVFTLDRTTIARDCFPSLHTALAVLMCIYVWRYRRKWSVVYIPLAGLIVVATMYLRFHYLSDVIAGAALAVCVSQLAPTFQKWWSGRSKPTEELTETGLSREKTGNSADVSSY